MRDLCASFQQAVVDVIADRLRAGLRMFREQLRQRRPRLVAAGGVAANEAIRNVLNRLAFEGGTVLVAPPAELCTDNGAMIAWAGAERLALGLTDTLDTAPQARWPLVRCDVADSAAASADEQRGRRMSIRAHRRGRSRRLGHCARAMRSRAPDAT